MKGGGGDVSSDENLQSPHGLGDAEAG